MLHADEAAASVIRTMDGQPMRPLVAYDDGRHRNLAITSARNLAITSVVA